MRRRAFLTATAAAATTATLKVATAATVTPLGETGVPLKPSEPLPLGPLPGSRYPDSAPGVLRKAQGFVRAQPGFPGLRRDRGRRAHLATGFRWAEGPVYFPAGR